MKKIKIESEVTKEDVFVCVANTSEYDEVCRIITAGGEQILNRPLERLITYSPLEGYWVAVGSMGDKYQISIPQLAELLGVEYPLKPKLKKGVWYRVEDGDSYAIIRFSGEMVSGNYGRNFTGGWTDAFKMVLWDGQTYKEATASEVERALIAEARKRGFKDGVEIDNSDIGVHDIWRKIDGDELAWDGKRLEFVNQGAAIFHDGKWAEVVEEERNLPTLEELIAEAKSKITKKTREFPCWVEGTREIEVYRIGGTKYMTEKLAIIGYIAERLREEYL